MNEIYYIITFNSTHSSISADALLEEGGIPHRLMPVPQSVSAGCGFCLRLSEKVFASAKAALLNAGVEMDKAYRAEKNGLKITYTILEE